MKLAIVKAIHRAQLLLAAALAVLATSGLATPASPANIASVVEKINSDAFYDFRSVPVAQPYPAVVVSPVLRWYMGFISSVGSTDAPSPQEEQDARAFVGEFTGAPDRQVAARVWATNAASYTEQSAAALENALYASTVSLTGATPDSQADGLMSAWISAHTGRNGKEIIARLNSPWSTEHNISHPFNAAAVLTQTVRFDAAPPAGNQTASLNSYSARGIQGVRLDSTASGIALYLFYGEPEAISEMHSKLSSQTWSGITTQFAPHVVKAPPLPLSVRERWKLRSAQYYNVFGTYLGEPGVESVDLDIDRTGMALVASSALHGYATPPTFHRDLSMRPKMASFNPDQSVLFVVVERSTGVIMAIGANIAS